MGVFAEIIRTDKILLNVCLLVLALIAIPVTWLSYSDKKISPTYEIYSNQWRVYFPKQSDSFDCSNDAPISSTEELCIGNPKNPPIVDELDDQIIAGLS